MKIREDEVLRALAKRHEGKDAFFTHVKNGPTHAAVKGELAIIDAIAFSRSWTHPLIRGYEVKVDRSDFLRDTKWHKYFDMCHEFSFVCPDGLIRPEEIPDQAGLIYYNPGKKSLRTKKKAVYRPIELPVNMLWYIIIAQLDSERHPFFSNRREALEAWVEDKEDRQTLGAWVSEKLHRFMYQYEQMKIEVERLKEFRELISKANAILEPYGVFIASWGNWEHDLQRVLQSGVPNLRRVLNLARQLENELSKLDSALAAQSEVM